VRPGFLFLYATDVQLFEERERPEYDFYPSWLAPDEASVWRDSLLADVPWRQETITLFGQSHPVPRLSAWFGDSRATYSYSGIRHTPLPWSPLLSRIRDRVSTTAHAPFNSVLVNWYRDGHDANGWHADDEPELGPRPVIASLSLGESRSFRFRRRDDHRIVHALTLAHGDLLVMKGESQSQWQHTIPRTKKPVAGRLNLTFRQIVTDL
jgi:alkylated DNA repair dioxygenase AlkB